MSRIGLWFALMAAFLEAVAVAFSPFHGASGTLSTASSTSICAFSSDVVPAQIHQDSHAMRLLPAQLQQKQPQSALNYGIRCFMETPFDEATTLTLSLKDRPPPPTAEELAAKKRNFNLWFWGGGFVAPFLATFYYFGFKFWEK